MDTFEKQNYRDLLSRPISIVNMILRVTISDNHSQ